jgi:hypothetical protein
MAIAVPMRYDPFPSGPRCRRAVFCVFGAFAVGRAQAYWDYFQ